MFLLAFTEKQFLASPPSSPLFDFLQGMAVPDFSAEYRAPRPTCPQVLGESGRLLPLRSLHYAVDVQLRVARTTLTAVFENAGLEVFATPLSYRTEKKLDRRKR